MSNIFLKIAGIEGEVADLSHTRWITVLEVRWGALQESVDHAGGFYGRPRFKDVEVVKDLDKSSPRLALACARGDRLEEGTLDFVRFVEGKAVTVYRIRLSDVRVSKIESRTVLPEDGGGNFPMQREFFSLSFEEIRWEYTELDEQFIKRGRVVAGWSIKKMQGL